VKPRFIARLGPIPCSTVQRFRKLSMTSTTIPKHPAINIETSGDVPTELDTANAKVSPAKFAITCSIVRLNFTSLVALSILCSRCRQWSTITDRGPSRQCVRKKSIGSAVASSSAADDILSTKYDGSGRIRRYFCFLNQPWVSTSTFGVTLTLVRNTLRPCLGRDYLNPRPSEDHTVRSP